VLSIIIHKYSKSSAKTSSIKMERKGLIKTKKERKRVDVFLRALTYKIKSANIGKKVFKLKWQTDKKGFYFYLFQNKLGKSF
jgi:hypothetical protein